MTENENESGAASGQSETTRPEPFLFLYFLRLVGRPVRREGDGAHIGRIRDFIIEPALPYPRVGGVVVATGWWRTVRRPWSDVRAMDAYEMVLAGETGTDPVPDGDRIGRDWLNRLAVDVSSRDVVRIRDVHFVYSENTLLLAHAETGLRGFLRKWRLERLALALFGRGVRGWLRERFATFRHLQPLCRRSGGGIRLTPRLLEMHPADLEFALRHLPASLRGPVFNVLPAETAARVLQQAAPEPRRRLLAAGGDPVRRAALEALMASLHDGPAL